MYNKVVLVGNLTRDVEIRYSQSGSAIASVGIATNRKWKSQTGEPRDEIMFIDLTFFGRTAEIAHQYLRKGSKVLVDGRLVFQQWTAQDGTKRSKHSITVESLQMLDTKSSSPNSNHYRDESTSMGGGYTNSSYGGGEPRQQQQQSYSQPQPPQQQPPSYQPQQQRQETVPEINIDEDEIPF